MKDIRGFARRIFSMDQGKYLLINLLLTLVLTLSLELMEFKSVSLLIHFIRERSFLFLFNGFMIFATLSVVLLFRKKIFAYALVGGSWFLVGLVNGVILMNRKTPFTAVDLTIVKSILPIVGSYLTVPEILLVLLLVILVIVGLVCLFLYSPEQKRSYDGAAGLFWTGLILLCFVTILKVGTRQGILPRKFDNLITAYQDYGVAYGFFITAVDTGIDRPLAYSEKKINKILSRVDKRIRRIRQEEKTEKDHHPNMIFIQLESFFDPTVVKDLTFSEDPLPNFHRIQKEVTSGLLRVPVYGAGTINTEFEVITGMSLDFFGSGEYPYRSILHKRTCDNISYWMREMNYTTSVIHNNNAAFYDRNKVFCNLGFQNFITIENMNIPERNEAGWAKDMVLKDYILDVLESTSGKDLIYAISVQGHGDYPATDPTGDERILVTGEQYDQKQLNSWTYYANEIYEMDEFIGSLVNELQSWPEEVTLVVYGDHLPGMNVENRNLKKGTRFDTPYFIWDNFGYNRENREKESGNLKCWQLASQVLGQSHIHHGVLNAYHQAMRGTKNYRKNLRMLQYDLLYGSGFSREGKDPLLPTTICYAIHNPEISRIEWDETNSQYLLIGSNFTEQSRVCVNGIRVPSVRESDTVIRISEKALKDKDEVTVVQVDVTNSKIVFNESLPLVFTREEEVLESPIE